MSLLARHPVDAGEGPLDRELTNRWLRPSKAPQTRFRLLTTAGLRVEAYASRFTIDNVVPPASDAS